MNILLIDDNEMSRTLLKAILTGKGHNIVGEASSGKQGLVEALRLKPDLICLDILMPDVDGIDVLRKILRSLPATIVLMVTGKRDKETAAQCLANGAKAVIVKPFDSDTVLSAIDTATKPKGTQTAFQIQRGEKAYSKKSSSLSLSSLKLQTRLGLGFGISILMTILTCLAGIWGLSNLNSSTNRMMKESFVKERLVTEWRHATNLNGTRAMAIAKNANLAEQESIGLKIKETSNYISGIQKQLEVLPQDATETALYQEISSKRKEYLVARDEVFSIKKTGNEDEARKLTDERLEPALTNYVAAIRSLSDRLVTETANSADDVVKQFSKSEIALVSLTILALLLGVGLAFFISRSIIMPLRTAIAVSTAVSNGDLTTAGIPVSGSDEISMLLWGLKNMNENLAILVGRVRASADTIAVAAGNITSGNLNLSTRTENQAASLEETASTMEELTSTVKQNSENVRQANQLAESASTVATSGGIVVSQVVDTMGSINDSSKKIADIIGVIDGIAFQTNILALNAAVEAARAGEQGRGFAVVATEVRNLAQRSAAAAKEIKTLIGDSVDKVEVGGKLVAQAGATMANIVASIKEVTNVVGEITIAGVEQSSGIEQINDAITHLDKTTQQNAILVEKSLESAQNMEAQARELVDIVSVFKLDHSQEVASTAVSKSNEVRGTAKEALALVKRAVAYRKTCASRDLFLNGLTDRKNKFFDRDMYVFALDVHGKYLAFGGSSEKVGTRVQDVPGVDGDGLIRAIVAQGNEGPGWVDYKIFNPVLNKLQAKMSYIELLDGVYIGCGVYTSLN